MNTVKVGEIEIPWIFSVADVSTSRNTTHFANDRVGDDDNSSLHALVIISMSTWEKIRQIADNHNENYSNDNCRRSRESYQYGPLITDEFITITPPIVSVSSFDPSSSTKSHESPSSDHDLLDEFISTAPPSKHQQSDECPPFDFHESNVMTNATLPKTSPMMIRLQFFHHIQNNQCPSDQSHDTHRSFRYNVIVESNANHRFDLVLQKINHQTTDKSTLRRPDRCQGNNHRDSQSRDSQEIILLTHMGRNCFCPTPVLPNLPHYLLSHILPSPLLLLFLPS